MKLKAFTLTLAALCIGIGTHAQSFKKLPKSVKKQLSTMTSIKGDTLFEPIRYYNAKPAGKRTVRAVVGDFYMASKETTNDDWRAFYGAMVAKYGKEEAKRFLPDTACWTKAFPHSYNQPMTDYYYYHPAYAKYPVVGITWNQAKAYCDWKTESLNNDLKAEGVTDVTISLRLPTAKEWELAASPLREIRTKSLIAEGLAKGKFDNYLWNLTPYSYGLINRHGYQANFGPIRDTMGFEFKSFADDGGFHTVPARCYWATDKGMYNIRGNVEEWVSDESTEPQTGGPYKIIMMANTAESDTTMRVAKGGSWWDGPYYLSQQAAKSYPANMESPITGFRVAMDIVEVKPAASK